MKTDIQIKRTSSSPHPESEDESGGTTEIYTDVSHQGWQRIKNPFDDLAIQDTIGTHNTPAWEIYDSFSRHIN